MDRHEEPSAILNTPSVHREISSEQLQALRVSLRTYRCLLPFAAAVLVPVFLRRMFRRGNFRAGFGQRLGLFAPEERARMLGRRWIWIRSISVGETMVALKLARSLREAEPDLSIALSVTTSTGYALASSLVADWLLPMYNPVDSQGAVNRTLDLMRPEGLVLVEGEVWPNLMEACRVREIPVMLANARLSPRSARRFARSKRWVAPFFRLLKWVGIPDEEDRGRWEAVGVSSERLHLTGSIKFDQTVSLVGRRQDFRSLLQRSGVPEGAPLWVAGSTHDGEEALLVACWKHLRSRYPTLRLIIAPRHVERVPELLAVLGAFNVSIVRRSALAATSQWDVLLVDTTGELNDWYAAATVTFVGKSLKAGGGQNPVEPALAGKPVLFGPHMENFEAVVKVLLAADGAIQVRDEAELAETVSLLLGDPLRCAKLGINAGRALRVHQGAAARTVELIQKACLR
ncbi:MAG: 3-deoxy-D-manno-octulosonic acid transferase [Verrucomicrobia bacterium]|nr:3-deoxy-D-manno-octulosonic acid transferase [Verrucomicrobiota bacterium]